MTTTISKYVSTCMTAQPLASNNKNRTNVELSNWAKTVFSFSKEGFVELGRGATVGVRHFQNLLNENIGLNNQGLQLVLWATHVPGF